MSSFTDLNKMVSKFIPSSSVAPMEEAVLNTMKLEVGIVSSLLAVCTMSSTTPEQRASAQAQEDQRQAALLLEDARKQEFMAEEERRRAYFANQGPGYS